MLQRRDQRDGRVPVEYSIAIEADFHQFTSDVENMAWLVTRLAAAAGDRSATSVSLTRVQGGSVIVSWVNNTLSTNRCPSDDIKAVLDRFVSPVDGQVLAWILAYYIISRLTHGNFHAANHNCPASYKWPIKTSLNLFEIVNCRCFR